MVQPKNQSHVIPFTDETSNNSKTSTGSFFNKPPKWAFRILKLIVIILMPLFSNSPDIQLNFYIINVMF